MIERNYLVMEKAAGELAGKIKDQGIKADLVMGAQMGSVRSSLILAEKPGVEVSIYTEKSGSNNEEMALKRHDISLAGGRVVISEDIVTKRSTRAKMKKMITDAGGEVVAIACVGNRFGKADFEGIPLVSCYTSEAFDMYWDEKTLQKIRENEAQAGKAGEQIEIVISDIQNKYSKLPEDSRIAEKQKNDWGELVESMRK